MFFTHMPLIKDIILSLAAIVTTSTAVYGVVKWKKELKGKAHLETAKSLMTAVYRVRNNFEIVRSGWRDVSEFPQDYIKNKKPGRKDPQAEADALWHLYQNRIAPLADAMSELDTSLLEAEALWGSEVKEYGRKINGCYNRLVMSIKQLVAEEYRGGIKESSESVKAYKADVIASRNSSDELSNQLSEAILYFKKITNKYLGK